MSNINDALEILLNEAEPVIYDYEKSNGYIFITIGYSGGRYFTISTEMLIDNSGENLSLVGHTSNSLKINKNTATNHLWSEMLVNDLNALSAESHNVGVWCCTLEGASLQDALELKGQINFQFWLNIPKSLDVKSTSIMIKSGIESYKKSVSRIQRFIHKCESSDTALSFEDVFPEKDNVQISFHPKLLDILKHSDEDENK